jgi:hypothetical protein
LEVWIFYFSDSELSKFVTVTFFPFMSERRFNIPTVEQIEQHKRKSKATNYFQQSKATGTTEESASTTSTPNEAIEITPQLNSSAAASSTISSETTSQNMTPPSQPVAVVRRLGPNTILVNQAQRGNPILQHVRNVPWEYDDIKADYTVGQTTCVLYLR